MQYINSIRSLFGYQPPVAKDHSDLEEGLFFDAPEELMSEGPETEEVYYDCVEDCCDEGNECRPSYMTTDTAIKRVAGACIKAEPFIPQSYTYGDFERNQKRALSQHSTYETVSVCQGVFSGAEKKTMPKQTTLITNGKTLVASRFFPPTITLNAEQERLARESDLLIEGPLEASLVGYIMKKVHTLSGREFLLVRASNPTRNINTVLRRQRVIDTFVREKELYLELATILKAYKDNEQDFCSRLAPNATKLPGRIESSLKFALFTIPERMSLGKQLNEWIRENSMLITVNSTIKTSMEGFQAALLPVMTVGLGAYACAQVVSPAFSPETTAMIDSTASRYIGQAGIAFSAIQSLGGRATNGVAAGLAAAVTALRIDDTIGYFRADWNVKVTLQHKMVKVARCIRAMKDAYVALYRFPALRKRLEHLQKLENLVMSNDPKVQKMLEAIHSSTLDEEKNFFCLGPVLVAWNLLLDKKIRELVLEAIIAMAEIDANFALASAVLESTEEHPVSIPMIVEGDVAVFDATDVHFPPVSMLAGEGQKTCESIKLDPLTVLTAENGAGKTTFGISWINLILSTQSLGIAACAAGTKVSMFDTVITSKGISDTNGLSTHEAHQKFAADLILKLQRHPEQKMLLLLDELYQGTHESKGATALNELVNNLTRQHPERFKAVFITHIRDFATDDSYEATKLTTTKTADGKPSGILSEGVYQFDS